VPDGRVDRGAADGVSPLASSRIWGSGWG